MSTAGAGRARASRPVTPVPASDVGHHDAESDVLVVGFGCAEAAAGYEAATAGAAVTVLERAGGPGGAAAERAWRTVPGPGAH